MEAESFGISEKLSGNAVLAVALKNLWIDACCIALFVLAKLGKNCDCEQSSVAKIYAAIYTGRALYPGDLGMGQTRPFGSVNELLLAMTRQRYAGTPATYSVRMDQYAEELAELSRAEMIAGRIYGWSGSRGLDSLEDEKLMALLLVVATRQQASIQLQEIVDRWSEEDDQKLREFQGMLNVWKERLGTEEFAEWRPFFDCVNNPVGQTLDFNDAVRALREFIDARQEGARAAHEEVLAEAPISERRLADLGRWSSETAFSKETGSFPIGLFAEVLESAEVFRLKF